jgi:hypothetical protein
MQTTRRVPGRHWLFPGSDRGWCEVLSDARFRQDIRERQSSVLQKLTAQKTALLPKTTFMKMSHPW